jgi:hypothetical protein
VDMNATPAALNGANNAVLTPGVAAPTLPSTNLHLKEKATVKKSRTITSNAARTPKPENPATAKSAGKSSRLQIRATRKGSQESWTVAASMRPPTKGCRQTSFRVRVSDVGFRVCLVYYDDLGKRREPYLCYLSAKEWQQAKRGTLAGFARLMTDKLAERAAKEGANSEKLSELSNRVKAFLEFGNLIWPTLAP